METVDERLHEAARKGDFMGVSRALTDGASPNAVSLNLWLAPLHVACVSRLAENAIVDLLIKVDADVDQRKKDGKTPLMLAAHGGHDDIIATLLSAQANVELRDKDGKSALDFATKEPCVRLLRGAVAKAEANAKAAVVAREAARLAEAERLNGLVAALTLQLSEAESKRAADKASLEAQLKGLVAQARAEEEKSGDGTAAGVAAALVPQLEARMQELAASITAQQKKEYFNAQARLAVVEKAQLGHAAAAHAAANAARAGTAGAAQAFAAAEENHAVALQHMYDALQRLETQLATLRAERVAGANAAVTMIGNVHLQITSNTSQPTNVQPVHSSGAEGGGDQDGGEGGGGGGGGGSGGDSENRMSLLTLKMSQLTARAKAAGAEQVRTRCEHSPS